MIHSDPLNVMKHLDVSQDNDEFIAAQAGNDVRCARTGADAARRLRQHAVAGSVTQRVVNFLEAVKIDKQQRQRHAATLMLANFLRQALAEHAPVWQTG